MFILYKVPKSVFILFTVIFGNKQLCCIETSATRISPLVISCLPPGFQTRRPRSAPHLTPDLEPRLQLQSDFTSLSQELEHVWCQWQQNTICAALARESPSNAKQAKPQEVHTEPNSSEWPENPHKGKERARVSCSKRRVMKRRKTRSSAKTAYVWKKLREPPRTLTRFYFCYKSIFLIPKQDQNMKLHVNQLHKIFSHSIL